jgi:CBS domain containing-hemolysin-like protein
MLRPLRAGRTRSIPGVSLLDLLVLLLLLLLSAAFSGSETALFSLGQTDLARLREGGGHRVLRLLEDAPRLLAALLIGNLLVNTAASVLATSVLVRRLGASGLVVAVPAMTVVLLLVGEITPKLAALRRRRRIARFVSPVLSVWVALLRPVLALVSRLSEGLLSRLPFERSGSRPLSVDELQTAAGFAVRDASLTETEGRFLIRLLGLGDLVVREIMTPRTAVVTLDAGLDRAAILRTARVSGYNRYPVTLPDRVQPVGVFHLKDLLDTDAAHPLAGSLREPVFVPESKSVDALLHELRAGRQHLAVVVDEHGDFVGIVTLEDCLEALTGQWRDESDDEDPVVLPVGDDNWVVDGDADLRTVNEHCGSNLPLSRDYVTLAGWLMTRLHRIPERGDRWVEDGWRVTVLAMDGRRVERVRIQRLAVPQEVRP